MAAETLIASELPCVGCDDTTIESMEFEFANLISDVPTFQQK